MTSFHSMALMLGMNDAQFQGLIFLMGLSIVAIGFSIKSDYDGRKHIKKNKDTSQ